MHHSFNIHSSVGGHLDIFNFKAILNRTTMKMFKNFYNQICSTFGIFPGLIDIVDNVDIFPYFKKSLTQLSIGPTSVCVPFYPHKCQRLL